MRPTRIRELKMKKIIAKFSLILICGIAFTNCNKNNLVDTDEIDGTYIGNYTTTNLTHGFSWSSTLTIELKNGKYTYKGLADGGYYDSGYGKFTINGSKIIFELLHYDVPMEDIGVIDEWLLQGEYEYTFKGNKLKLSKTYPVMDMEYGCEFKLEKNASR